MGPMSLVDPPDFFFNDTATTDIYTLSLHDALPICFAGDLRSQLRERNLRHGGITREGQTLRVDRKSTRLNSSHTVISYAVFCLKKKRVILMDAPCSTWYVEVTRAIEESMCGLTRVY